MFGDPGLAVSEIQQLGMAANAPRRSSPDCVQHLVQKLAALRGSESGFGRLPPLRAQACRRECLERTLRLKCEHRCAAGNTAAGQRNAAEILDGNSQGVGCELWQPVNWKRLRHDNLRDKPRGSSFNACHLCRKTEMDFWRRSDEPRSDCLGQIPIELRRCMRHAGRALDFRRQQRVG